MYQQLPAVKNLNDFWKDLGKAVGLDTAVKQVDESTKTIDKASSSIDNINTTVNQMKKEYDYLKPMILTFFGLQAVVWLTEIIRNSQQIVGKK